MRHIHHPTWKIGTMVAANSGKPGGACGGEALQFDKLHAGHRTQEEDIISNWLLTGAHNSLCSAEADVKNFCVQRFKGAVQRKWGLYSTDGRPHERLSPTHTIQGVDYTTTVKPTDYADAWVVREASLSRKDVNASTGSKSFNHLSQYPTSLVFVGGPNAGASRGSVASSTRRTFNQACEADYNLFRECLKAALRAGLLAMAMEGCDAVLLAGGVSTGLYQDFLE